MAVELIQAVSDLTTPKEVTKSRWSPNDDIGDLATPAYFKLGGSARSYHIVSSISNESSNLYNGNGVRLRRTYRRKRMQDRASSWAHNTAFQEALCLELLQPFVVLESDSRRSAYSVRTCHVCPTHPNSDTIVSSQVPDLVRKRFLPIDAAFAA